MTNNFAKFLDSHYLVFRVLIAECITLESYEKKSDECRSNEQRRAFSELIQIGFDIITSMILQNATSRFNLFWIFKVLIAECVTLESYKKNSFEGRSKEQRRPFLELSFELALTLWLPYYLSYSCMPV